MRLKHGGVWLELHELARRDGPALLLLHALYGSRDEWGETPGMWPGSVYALDFSGHGRSGWVIGGGYTTELFAGDADAALAHIGRAALAGAGMGAYVALLLAGARPDLVPAALLLSGAGIEGAGAAPDFENPRHAYEGFEAVESYTGAYDPMVTAADRIVRPLDYVEPFAHAAHRVLLVEDGQPRPPWWQAIRQSPSAEAVPSDLPLALARLADATR
jgi:pimeloyl-ACP methyl ester carboxylesterase